MRGHQGPRSRRRVPVGHAAVGAGLGHRKGRTSEGSVSARRDRVAGLERAVVVPIGTPRRAGTALQRGAGRVRRFHLLGEHDRSVRAHPPRRGCPGRGHGARCAARSTRSPPRRRARHRAAHRIRKPPGPQHPRAGVRPLGRVERGTGNDASRRGGGDGAGTKTVMATYYLHGPVLARNPALAGRLSAQPCLGGTPSPRSRCPIRNRRRPPLLTAFPPSVCRYLRMFTARAITNATVTRETNDWASMVSFAHRDSGSTSVGLNAVALVNDRYR